MQKNQLFSIFLPDPTAPFYNPKAAFYVGTQEEILRFVDRLEASPKASWYKDVIAAVRAYSDDPEIRYEIAGLKYPAMMPVTEIGRKEFSLSDHTWIHKVPHESVQHLMRAGYVWVSYMNRSSSVSAEKAKLYTAHSRKEEKSLEKPYRKHRFPKRLSLCSMAKNPSWRISTLPATTFTVPTLFTTPIGSAAYLNRFPRNTDVLKAYYAAFQKEYDGSNSAS